MFRCGYFPFSAPLNGEQKCIIHHDLQLSFLFLSLFLSMDMHFIPNLYECFRIQTHIENCFTTKIQKWKAMQFTVNVFLLRNKNIHVKFYYWNCKCRYYSAILIGECRQNLIKNVIISAFHFDSSNLIKNSFVCCQWVYLFGKFYFFFVIFLVYKEVISQLVFLAMNFWALKIYRIWKCDCSISWVFHLSSSIASLFFSCAVFHFHVLLLLLDQPLH